MLDPLCQRCEAHGRTTVADMVHHVVPLAEDPGLRLVMPNLKSVCYACHGLEEAELTAQHGGGRVGSLELERRVTGSAALRTHRQNSGGGV